ncbi:hypothetical protein Q9L58_007052 [Maublancomyces gigas]|uniref:Uncharacterized protein n=1 Tax=Discina gigas TaxID=1032678 RepID=A0ABR3GDP2_9PEZI
MDHESPPPTPGGPSGPSGPPELSPIDPAQTFGPTPQASPRSPRSRRAFGHSPGLESYAQNSQGVPYPQPPSSAQAPHEGLGIRTPRSPRRAPRATWTEIPPSPRLETHSPPYSPRLENDLNSGARTAREEGSGSEASSFTQCRISLAVDISGSTAGRILNSEREFVMKLVSQLTPETISQNAYVLPWNHAAARPCQIQNLLMLESFGGTNPVVLLNSQPHLAALKVSNLWFLLTDGEITSRDVRALATTLAEKSMHGVPCVIVIFDNKSKPPSNCNISVGISPFAAVPNSALLYQDITVGGKCHVLATKGCFDAFLPAGTEQPVLDASTSWDSLPTIHPESAFRDLIIPAARELAPGELALSNDLTINFDNLFETDLDNGQIDQLLGNQNHLQSLLLSTHSRGQSASALSWLQRQTAVPQPSRVNNRLSTLDPAAATSIRRITAALQSRESIVSPELSALQRELRESHRRNSQITQDRDSRTNIINSAIDSLQQASQANWASSSLSTTRQSPAPSLSRISDSESAPEIDRASTCRGECPICFESDSVLAILFKRPQGYVAASAPKNTTLTFPLASGSNPEHDIISAWLVCEACSEYLVSARETPFRETATSALPLVSWSRNSALWRRALSQALDHFSGASQPLLPILFLAILDHHLQTKAWCIPDGSAENAQRATALNWARSTILTEVKMSGDGAKGPLGPWISTVVAAPSKGELGLIWKYPVDGFVLMLAIARERGTDPALLTKTLWRKLLHQVTGRYAAELAGSDHARMSARVDAVLPGMQEAGWIDVLLTGKFRPIARSEVQTLRRLSDEMMWIEAVCGPAMGRWLRFLQELTGGGKSTAECIWEIKGRWGKEAETVVERPEDIVDSSGL